MYTFKVVMQNPFARLPLFLIVSFILLAKEASTQHAQLPKDQTLHRTIPSEDAVYVITEDEQQIYVRKLGRQLQPVYTSAAEKHKKEKFLIAVEGKKHLRMLSSVMNKDGKLELLVRKVKKRNGKFRSGHLESKGSRHPVSYFELSQNRQKLLKFNYGFNDSQPPAIGFDVEVYNKELKPLYHRYTTYPFSQKIISKVQWNSVNEAGEVFIPVCNEAERKIALHWFFPDKEKDTLLSLQPGFDDFQKFGDVKISSANGERWLVATLEMKKHQTMAIYLAQLDPQRQAVAQERIIYLQKEILNEINNKRQQNGLPETDTMYNYLLQEMYIKKDGLPLLIFEKREHEDLDDGGILNIRSEILVMDIQNKQPRSYVIPKRQKEMNSSASLSFHSKFRTGDIHFTWCENEHLYSCNIDLNHELVSQIRQVSLSPIPGFALYKSAFVHNGIYAFSRSDGLPVIRFINIPQ